MLYNILTGEGCISHKIENCLPTAYTIVFFVTSLLPPKLPLSVLRYLIHEELSDSFCSRFLGSPASCFIEKHGTNLPNSNFKFSN